MTRDETRGEIDLSLPIEGFEQSDTDVLGTGGQVIERLAAIAGNAGWRHIEIASNSAIAPCRTPRTASLWPSRSAVSVCFNIWWTALA